MGGVVAAGWAHAWPCYGPRHEPSSPVKVFETPKWRKTSELRIDLAERFRRTPLLGRIQAIQIELQRVKIRWLPSAIHRVVLKV